MNSFARVWIGLVVAAAFYWSSATASHAGGSIGWPQVHDEIAKDDPFLVQFIDKTFEMRRSGGGVRVGHGKDGNSLVPGVGVGTRLPPFDFLAKPIGQDGDYTLHVTLEPAEVSDPKSTLWVVHVRKRLPTD